MQIKSFNRLNKKKQKNEIIFFIDIATITMEAKDKVIITAESNKFDESYSHPDMETQRIWREAIKKEFSKMTRQ